MMYNFKYSFQTIDMRSLALCIHISYNLNIVKINWHISPPPKTRYLFTFIIRIRNNLLISHASRLSN